ncbi:hypothetical protein DMUE_3313 [Dictyocoela muelleri]|nr:hypothetical protein DMUE_3313 [Dictyocoela muelleri]
MKIKIFTNLIFLQIFYFLKNCNSTNNSDNNNSKMDKDAILNDNNDISQKISQEENNNILFNQQQLGNNKDELINNYFDNISCQLLNFLVSKKIITKEEIYNLIFETEQYKNIPQVNRNINLVSINDFLSTLGYKFLPEICKKFWDYKKRKNIYGFINYNNDNELKELINDIEDKYIYINDKLTYDWLIKIMACRENPDNQMFFSLKNKFILISPKELKLDDVNVVWRIYNDLKKYKMYSKNNILITITNDDEIGKQIRTKSPSKACTYIHEPSFQYFGGKVKENTYIYGLYAEKIAGKVESYFYNSKYISDVDSQKICFSTPVLDIKVKMPNDLNTKSKISLKVLNKITNIKREFILTFENFLLSQVTYGHHKLILHDKLIYNLLESIDGLNENPIADINSIAKRSFFDEPIFFFEINKQIKRVLFTSDSNNNWEDYVMEKLVYLKSLKNINVNIDFIESKKINDNEFKIAKIMNCPISKEIIFKGLSQNDENSISKNDFMIVVSDKYFGITKRLYLLFADENIFISSNFPFQSYLHSTGVSADILKNLGKSVISSETSSVSTFIE